ncbi:MAG: hypothetical protein WC891_02845 [Actinomycetota bacterium]
MSSLTCPKCSARLKELDIQIEVEGMIGGTFNVETGEITDYDSWDIEITKNNIVDYECPKCHAEISFDELSENGVDVCLHRRTQIVPYLDGSAMLKCVDCHLHVEFIEAAVA